MCDRVEVSSCPGCDGISAEMWKRFSENEQGMGILVDTFNKISRGKAYGEELKMAVACPIYKNKGSVREPNNYTGVSLLRAVGKIPPPPSALASILSLMNDNKILSRLQAGFV